MNDYNGFPGWYRTAAGAPFYAKVRSGRITLTACELCGSTESLMIHMEDYEAPDTYNVLCRGCHMTLHKRFNQPDAWLRLLARIDAGTCVRGNPLHQVPAWARTLSLTPVDLRAGRPPLTRPAGGSSGDWSGSAANGFADRARARKAGKLALWIRDAGIDLDAVQEASDDDWADWSAAAGIRPPSEATVLATYRLLTTTA